jgi:hypothetical protein
MVNGSKMIWAILANHQVTGSDHQVIEWEVQLDRRLYVNRETVVRWNLAGMTEKHVECSLKRWMELAKYRASLGAE